MMNLWRDIKYGCHMLGRNPGSTMVVIITLALGIGANTSIFSVVDGVLFRPLPFYEPDRLVMVWQTDQNKANQRQKTSYPNAADWRKDNQVFEDIAVFRKSSRVYSDAQGACRVPGGIVSASFFSVLGVKPQLGRTFLIQEDQPGDSRAVILSHEFWQRQLGADPKIIDKTIQFDKQLFTVVGVLPPTFGFPDDILGKAQIWTTISEDSWAHENRGCVLLYAVARLKPGVSLRQAQTQMHAIGSRLANAYEENEQTSILVAPLHGDLVRRVSLALWLLMGAVGFVLLIACANAANLLMIRATDREKEFAIRSAMGAGKLRLIRQSMIESLLISLISGALAIVFAYWTVDVIKVLVPSNLPLIDQINLSGRVVLFTFIASVAVGIIFGLIPMLQGSMSQIIDSLRTGTTRVVNPRQSRLHRLFVVGQLATAMVLLVGAGLLLRSFWLLTHVDTGFKSRRVLTLKLELPGARYPGKSEKQALYKHLETQLNALPGVDCVGATTSLPFSSEYTNVGIQRPESPTYNPDDYLKARYSSVTPGYFQAMSIPLLKGHIFTESDMASGTGMAVISEAMARLYWPDRDPLGSTFECGLSFAEDDPRVYRIVGIVADVKQRGFDTDVIPEYYVPYTQQTFGKMTVAIRTHQEPTALIPSIRNLIHQIDPELLIDNVKIMEQWKSESVARRGFIMKLVVLLAALALSLTVIGVYAMMAYFIKQRTKEIGVRVAMGGRPSNIVVMVINSSMKLTLCGIAIGLLGALFLSRYLGTMLYEVTPTDPITYMAVVFLLLGVSTLACYIPAKQATRIDPMVALKCE